MEVNLAGETGGHGGDLTTAAQLSCLPAHKILDFSSNINPLGPPTGLITYLRKQLTAITGYPEPQARTLRTAIAEHRGISAQQLLIGNGANDLIHLLLLWWRPRRVLIPAPAFAEYRRAAALTKAEIVTFELPPQAPLQIDAIAEHFTAGDLVVFCNPNNPTGTLYPRQDLEELANRAEKRGAYVLLDESFISLTATPAASLQTAGLNNLFVVVSLTKCWALPGLRLGYMVGPTNIMQRLTAPSDPWRVNMLAQQAGLYCLAREQNYMQRTLDLLAGEKEYLAHNLQQTGRFTVYPGAANFLLVHGKEVNFNVSHLYQHLLKQGILIRSAANFENLDHTFFRIAVRRRPENRRLVNGIKDYLQGYLCKWYSK